MNTLLNPRAKALLLTIALGAAPAFAGGPATTGALATKANRIVGTWLAVGDVSGANCFPSSPAPAIKPNVYLMYHAGGTITELPRLPFSTSPSPRTIGVGNWYYDTASDTYYVSFRFDWYDAAGALKGYATVDREIKLDDGGDSLSGSVIATRYLDNGTEVFAQCGTGTAKRL
jgi:hypothetical protein